VQLRDDGWKNGSCISNLPSRRIEDLVVTYDLCSGKTAIEVTDPHNVS